MIAGTFRRLNRASYISPPTSCKTPGVAVQRCRMLSVHLISLRISRLKRVGEAPPFYTSRVEAQPNTAQSKRWIITPFPERVPLIQCSRVRPIYNVQTRVRRSDGQRLWIECNAQPRQFSWSAVEVGAAGAAEVAWFPGLVQRAQGVGNVLRELRAGGRVDGIGGMKALQRAERVERTDDLLWVDQNRNGVRLEAGAWSHGGF
jgi:hypothetical protein